MLIFDSHNQPSRLLRLEGERELLIRGGTVLLSALGGILIIAMLWALLAYKKLQRIVLRPLAVLLDGVQLNKSGADPDLLPIIDSSLEMSILTRSFHDMAKHQSQQFKAVQNHSQRMEESANLDPLTGCHNRRYLNAWQTTLNYQHCHLLAVMVDLDHFKRVNDTHGHDVGDLVLVQLSERLRSQLRKEELLIRLGGEEFLIITECQQVQGAIALTERLVKSVAATPFGRPEQPLALTASMGFSLFPLGGERHLEGWQLCLKLADIALYESKIRSRNTWTGFAVTDVGSLPTLESDTLIQQGAVQRYYPEMDTIE